MMHYPEFFDAAPVIMMRDPLAEFLGAMQDGLMEYRYADVVALAGHSCPTVASAFLMTRAALNALYPGEVPLRGDLRVELQGAPAEGTVGVVANVVSYITGAAGEGGFHGIGGRFERRELLGFGAEAHAEIRFTRTDNGARAEVSADLSSVPMDPRVRELLPRCLTQTASPAETGEFRRLWQDRVRRLLLDHKDDPAVILLRVH